ncbi:MAG TPA: recombinase family protein [Drouetiella sp.]
MSSTDNKNESLRSTFYDTRKVYDPRPREGGCLCVNAPKADWYRGKPKGESLIAYVRAAKDADVEGYIKEINRYCQEHSYKIADVFTDVGDQPSFGLQAAFDALEHADGLISCEMNMFIKHNADRIRELRPFIHHFFCLRDKHLITIVDGIDTGSSFGQENAIQMICETKAGFDT